MAAKRKFRPTITDRDRRLVAFVEQQPATIEQIKIKIGFPSFETARRRCQRLEQSGIIRVVGYVRSTTTWTGRKKTVYSTKQRKIDRIDHDVKLTQFLLELPVERVERNQLDPSIRADALLRLGRRMIHVEFENTRKNSAALRRRMAVYENIDDLVLWGAESPRRITTLKGYATKLENTALFGVLGQPKWQDIEGVKIHWSQL